MKQQMLEKEVAQLRQDLVSGKPMYKVGEMYKTISGNTVTIAGYGDTKHVGNSYETVYWRDSEGNKCHHYNRRDYGRVTGTSCIDQDPRCLVPLWKDYVGEYLRAKDSRDKLKQQVIDLKKEIELRDEILGKLIGPDGARILIQYWWTSTKIT